MLFKLEKAILLSIVVGSCDLAFGYPRKGCHLNVTNIPNEKYLPVPLYNHSSYYELSIPFKGAIELQQGAKLSLLCPGVRNYITVTNSNITSVTCLENSAVQLFNSETDFENIKCRKAPKGDVSKTQQKCGNGAGYLYKIGYQVTKKHWVAFIEACHVPEIGNTLYTHHVIYGKSIKYASKSNSRPGFSTAGLNNEVTASVAYKKEYQKLTFNKILGSAVLADTYISNSTYLARGHLAPNADFLLATAQHSTYFYINTAPQWQQINGGNWKSIESTIRKLSQQFDLLQIITGTHGVIHYPSVKGSEQPIYLVSATKKLPVPKYFWKLVYDPENEEAILFVILNDPYTKEVSDEDVFCADICRETGYRNAAWKKINFGYVFCCDFREAKNKIDYVPSFDVTGILSI